MSDKIIKLRPVKSVSTNDLKQGLSGIREISRTFAHIFGGVTKVMDLAHEVVEDIESGHDIEYRHAQKQRKLARDKRQGVQTMATGKPTSTKKTATPAKKVAVIIEEDVIDVSGLYDDMDDLAPKKKQKKSVMTKPTSKIKQPKGIDTPKRKGAS